MKPKRVFVAINPPPYVRQTLVDLDPHMRGVRWIEAEQMHLTLGFFGLVPEDVGLAFRSQLGRIEFRQFVLPLSGLGKFPANGPPKIVWIAVGSGHPHLFQLHKRVQDAAVAVGLDADLRPWHPHVTLARCHDVPAGTLRKFLKTYAEFTAGMFKVDEFHLYSSELTPSGAIHTCEMTVKSRDIPSLQ